MIRPTALLLLAASLILGPTASAPAQTVYRWRDAKGGLHFSNQSERTPNEATAVELPPLGSIQIPATSKRARQRARAHREGAPPAAPCGPADPLGLIDAVSFGSQTNDVSQGRYPDGTPTIEFFGTPTPGGPNTLGSNAPPVITAIPDINITAGQTLSFTVTASDPDSPLTFALNSPPSGATIGASSGLFSWPTQVPSTNQLTVRVTDSGSPPLSATRTFTVRVRPPARATITVNSGQISLTFNTLAGRHYRVDYADTIAPEPIDWQPLAAAFTASGSSTTIQDDIGANEQRFYRIVQDP